MRAYSTSNAQTVSHLEEGLAKAFSIVRVIKADELRWRTLELPLACGSLFDMVDRKSLARICGRLAMHQW